MDYLYKVAIFYVIVLSKGREGEERHDILYRLKTLAKIVSKCTLNQPTQHCRFVTAEQFFSSSNRVFTVWKVKKVWRCLLSILILCEITNVISLASAKNLGLSERSASQCQYIGGLNRRKPDSS